MCDEYFILKKKRLFPYIYCTRNVWEKLASPSRRIKRAPQEQLNTSSESFSTIIKTHHDFMWKIPFNENDKSDYANDQNQLIYTQLSYMYKFLMPKNDTRMAHPRIMSIH